HYVEKNPAEIHSALSEVCGELTVDRSTVSRWASRFRGGRLLEAGPIILHDNARPHIGNVVTEKLRQYGWEVLPHAPYSPDMSPPDFDLFPKLKQPMRGRRFPSLEELSAAVNRAIRPINKDGVLDGIVKLPTRWDSVIEKQGDYTGGL
ncbi:hypothetical protein B7P43_G10893, partial [Cryptotermes secundus]